MNYEANRRNLQARYLRNLPEWTGRTFVFDGPGPRDLDNRELCPGQVVEIIGDGCVTELAAVRCLNSPEAVTLTTIHGTTYSETGSAVRVVR